MAAALGANVPFAGRIADVDEPARAVSESRTMNPAFRKFHRFVAPWIFLPLLVTVITGMAYRLGRAWFDLGKVEGSTILHVHIGEWLGKWGSLAYVTITALGLLALIATGATMIWKSRSKLPQRRIHRVLGLILLLPLTATAVTGLAYRIGEQFFHMPEATEDLLMKIHQGSWLGKPFTPFYVLLLGAGLLVLLFTGLQMTGLFRKKSHHPA